MAKIVAMEVKDAVKRFGTVNALSGVSLEVRANEFFTLLGPSGCGKTTLLRAIAGFEALTSGSIELLGEDIGGLPPNKRPINTVFQHYALFPHMTVEQNVAFGLDRLGRPAEERNQEVRRMLKLTRLHELADRRPHQLSGGQQQRVALARALAPNPQVLLLDEPLSALDLKLRQSMRLELKRIQRDTGITFVFVTHDQEEAITLSDRIAVLSNGKVQQVGSARQIYEAPVNRFVADFIGNTNIVDGEVVHMKAGAVCKLPGGAMLSLRNQGTSAADIGPRHVLLRPDHLSLIDESTAIQGMRGKIVESAYLGTAMQFRVKIDGGPELLVNDKFKDLSEAPPALGSRTGVAITRGAVRLLVD